MGQMNSRTPLRWVSSQVRGKQGGSLKNFAAQAIITRNGISRSGGLCDDPGLQRVAADHERNRYGGRRCLGRSHPAENLLGAPHLTRCPAPALPSCGAVVVRARIRWSSRPTSQAKIVGENRRSHPAEKTQHTWALGTRGADRLFRHPPLPPVIYGAIFDPPLIF